MAFQNFLPVKRMRF